MLHPKCMEIFDNMPSPQEKEPIYTKWLPSCDSDISSYEMFWKDCCTTPADFTSRQLDPFQFAYKSHRGVDDAVLTLLHKAFLHLDKPGSFIRVLFVNFSSAFSTIQPHLLAEELLCL